MTLATPSKAQEIRQRIGHPVVDADGHMLEIMPVLLDFLQEVGGSRMIEKWQRRNTGPWEGLFDHGANAGWWDMTPKERRDTGTMVGFWWFLPADTKYRATAHIPRMFYDRLDEFGIDFAVNFPTTAVAFGAIPGLQDDELRQAMCRAYNRYAAELYGPYADRMTPAATIPMHTPQEAIAELEYAVKELGLKVAMFPSYVVREVKREPGNERIPEGRLAPFKLDVFGIDSDYDYDPVWAKCVELGIAPCFHGTANGIYWGPRNSPTNLMYNTVGNFAESGDAVSKALFMGGVSRRFPQLRMAFLEGGVGRGILTFAGMLEFWEKRNPKTMAAELDPARLDLDEMMHYVEQYGEPRIKKNAAAIRQMFEGIKQNEKRVDIPGYDDWYGAQITKKADFRTLYENNFFWGCEADDPTTAWAFADKVNPQRMKFRAFFGSDISHCDVLDPAGVVPEAYELVEHGAITDEDFKDFVFRNAVRLYGGMNPHFFDGTPMEKDARDVLSADGLLR